MSAHVIRGMVLRCLFALSVVGGMAAGAFFLARGTSQGLRNDAALINLAGRQRMLVLQAANLAEAVPGSTEASAESSRASRLRKLADQLESTHHSLVQGDQRLGADPASHALHQVLYHPPHRLDGRMRQFVDGVRRLSVSAGDAATDASDLDLLRDAVGDDRLLAALDAMVDAYEQESQDKLDRLRATEAGILGCTLVALVFTWIGVFRPMIRRVRSETTKLSTANEALDRQARTLAKALERLRVQDEERRGRMRAMANVMEDLADERAALQREIQCRQLVQDALESSERRFYAIIESAPTAMVMIDRTGTIVLINSQTEALFGYQRSELLGQPIEVLVPPRLRKRHPEYRNRFLRNPTARSMGEGRDLYGVRKDGREIPIEIGLNPLEAEEGFFVLSAIVDITERKRAEQQIRKINDALRRKNEEMQQFVSTISHDLKSPLVTCQGFAGVLRDDLAQGRYENLIDSVVRIEQASERMGNLIEDLLQLSRIGSVRNDPEQIDVNELLQGLAADFEPRLKDAGARLHIQPDLPQVVADRIRLRQVFENLLANAIKYACHDAGARIDVGGSTENDEIRYFVRDNGPGIAPEFHERIFRLFQRLESDRDGTGVGLAAVSRIMEVHGGRAGVDSEPGSGATFWIVFPAQPQPLEQIADSLMT